MDVEAVKRRIKEIIRESAQLGSADIDDRALLRDELRIDSLTLLEVALTIDDEFKTDFTDEELMMMVNVQRAAELVVDRLNGGSRS